MPTPIDPYKYLQNFDKLPDAAALPDEAAAIFLGISIQTLRRKNPVPRIKVGANRIGRRVGDLRVLTRTAAA